MKACPNCDSLNDDNAKFCNKCGARLDYPTDTKDSDKKSSCGGCLAAVVVLVIIIAAIASCSSSCGAGGDGSSGQQSQQSARISKTDKQLGSLSGNKKDVVTALVKEHGFSYKQGMAAWKIIKKVGCETIELDKEEIETGHKNRQKITGDLPKMGNDPMYADVQILAVKHKLKSILLNYQASEVGFYAGAITHNLKYGEHDVERQATLWSAYDGYQTYYNSKKNAIVPWSKRPK